ncbi:MAG: protein-L-isoaspartate(D-aspartate) O-methyltransferase [Gemmatimonadota bacterium]|nr:protein-L-isoaspartate(D-aspartate) O-methyltransferase [Gemmatimonadota bacterium]MDH3571595.1 protein-L-isoaspartate(D-aspartate) O-methyltransferase [Gemmatimonadota bacterium]MDH5548695.1 protein-L-isoaspartate(D-aspartate) O-methyltransferase [Gemmatimonadota bacterium]
MRAMTHPERRRPGLGRSVPPLSVLVAAIVILLVPTPTVAQERGQRGADRTQAARQAMVELIAARGVVDSATLRAMERVPRHEFVPGSNRSRAYGDHPLPIGYGQTISQPYIVAYMTEVIGARPGMKVLEVGTGSGYQAAVLADIGARVFTVELVGDLATTAAERLERLGYANVTVRHADGHVGWEEEAPFDAVIVTAAAGYIPPALTAQLRPGGRMVIPVGSVYGIQNLVLVQKDQDGRLRTANLLPVRFVPMLEGLR